jgi:hypothetical protein
MFEGKKCVSECEGIRFRDREMLDGKHRNG